MANEIERTEAETDVDGLEKSLKELIKVADATSLVKGGVENSGHVDERGKVGGGSSPDPGGLDDMMIGKLVAAGVSGETIADFGAYMAAKQSEDEEEDEDEEQEGKMSVPPSRKSPSSGGGTLKSDQSPDEFRKAMDEFREDPSIADTVDVSPYIEAFTQRVAEQLDGLRKSVSAHQGEQGRVNRAIAGAMYQLGGLVKSQSAVIGELGRRLGIVEKQPAAPKGARSLPAAQALAKGMPGEAGGAVEGEPLNKADLLSVLTYMRLVKGVEQIGNRPIGEVIYKLDGGNLYTPDVPAAAQKFLRENPAEAEVARTYQ